MSVIATGYQSLRNVRRGASDLAAEEISKRRRTAITRFRRTRRPHCGTCAEKRRFVRETRRSARRPTAYIALRETRRGFTAIILVTEKTRNEHGHCEENQ